jgi:putative phosphoesterase
LRLLVLSDIHSNLVALQAVLGDAGDFDGALCAGDIVGYGPSPTECIELISRARFECIAGNHDVAVTNGNISNFNPLAAAAVKIHRNLLDIDYKDQLRSLPKHLAFNLKSFKIVAYHGSPRDPLNEYIFPTVAAKMAAYFFDITGADLIVLGHTHLPYLHRLGGRVILNPGSVGQPRDGDTRASYMMLDFEKGKISIAHKRVDYNVEEVASQMRHLGLPEVLAVRLFHGW